MIFGGIIIFEWFIPHRTTYGPGPIEIEVTTHKPFYHHGENVYFVIYVNNSQDWPVAYPDCARQGQIEKDGVVYLEGVDVSVDYGYDRPTFPAHSITPYHPLLFWNQKTGPPENQTQVEPGNYTVSLYIAGIGYESNGNCTIEIHPTPVLL